MAKLVLNPTSSSRREVPLPRALLSIGRDPTNDLVLPDALVSRRHAVVEFRGDEYFLRDCNSSNGSLVNGDRVSEHVLKDGDLLAIGTARILFRETAETEEAAAKVVPHPSSRRYQCPACHADYRKADQFCKQCGKALPVQPAEVVCATCGKSVPLPARFCSGCGAALPHEEVAAAVPPTPADPRPVIAPGREMSRPGMDTPPPAATVPAPHSEGLLDAISAAASPARLRAPARPRASEPAALSRTPFPAAVPRPSERPSRLAPGPPAGFAPRLAAWLVDAVLVGLAQSVVMSPAVYTSFRWWRELQTTPTDTGFLPVFLSVSLVAIALILGAGYYVYYWGVKGATPGKRLMGLRVEGADGTTPIGLGRALLRLLGYALSTAILGIGFLMIAFGGYGLHDRLASTRVVRVRGGL